MDIAPDPNPPGGSWRDLLVARQLATLLAVCLGVWLHAADGLMVATLIPDIVRDIGGAHFMSWTLALYEIGSIAAGAASAVLAMRIGLRRAMTLAALVYLVGCVTSALAPDIGIMLAGRLAQGLGGGGLVALSFVAVSTEFDRALMPRVIAAISALWGISSFVGPLVGGLAADWGVWRDGFWFFAVQAALLAAWISFGPALRNSATQADAGRVPLLRLAVLGAGVVAIAAAGIRISPIGTPLLLVAGFALLGLFFALDDRAGADRLLPRHAIDPRRPVGAGLIMLLAFSAATVAIGIYGPLTMVIVHGATPLTAGYLLAISSIAWSIFAIVVSGVPERHDGAMVLTGFAVLLVGVAGYAYAVAEGPLWLIGLCAAFEGGGFGIAWTFVLRRITALAEPGEKERVSSALPTLQRLGYATGAALMGIIANAAGISEHMDAATAHRVASAVFIACLPLAALGLLAALRFVAKPA